MLTLGPRRVGGLSAAVLALATMVAGAGCSKPAADSAATLVPIAIGDTVPEYRAVSLAGEALMVGANEPVTVLNVWATWCTSCREEMAALDSLRREFGPRGLRVIGVSVDQAGDARVAGFVAAEKLGFTVVHDSTGSIQQLYRVAGVPTTFLIGPDGRLVWRRTGNIEGVLTNVRTEITRSLDAAPSRAKEST